MCYRVRDPIASTMVNTMNELQAAEQEPEQTQQPAEQAPVEPVESGSELATDSPNGGEENTGSTADASQDPKAYTAAINKQHLKYRNEERRANRLQKKLDEMQPVAPVAAEQATVPNIPDTWEPDYEAKVAARDKVIADNALANSVRLQQEQSTVQAERDHQIKQQEASNKRVQTWSDNAKRLNVSQESLAGFGQAIHDYGVTDEIGIAIMEDDDGPVIAQYLAANPLELGALNDSSGFNAGKMWGDIKAKAAKLKPTVTNAPAPATSVTGGGKVPGNRGSKGASFE